MGSGIDAMLDKFGPRNVTAVSTNGLLRVLPSSDVLPPVASLSEVTALLLGGPHAEVTEQAARHVDSDALRKAVWVTTGLDAGDGIVTVVSSLRSALALYLARKSGKTAPAAWVTHQAGDAVLKAVGIAHLLDLCFPGSDDPVLELAKLPAGRALFAYFAAAEVALPFMEQLADGEHALERLIPEHLDAQVSKLSTVAGRSAVDAAQLHLHAITLTVDVLVSHAGEYIGPFVQSAEGAFPGAGRVVDTVGDIVAAGADVLPVYRFLGVRLVAEAAVVRAARELGVEVPDSGLDWIAAYVDAPRRAWMAASAEAAAVEAGEGGVVEDSAVEDAAVEDAAVEDAAVEDGLADGDGAAPAGGPDGARLEPVGPADVAPEPVSPKAERTPATPATPATPPAVPPAVAPAPAPAPAPSEEVEEAVPPPLPIAASAPAQKTEPSSSEPAAPPKKKTAPPPLPVHKPKLAPSTPSQPSPTPPPAEPQQAPATPPKPVARVAPPPMPATTAPQPSPRDSSSTGEDMSKPAKSGVSIAAIGVAVALVALLGCAGVLGLGGVGALFMGAHEEASDETSSSAGKGTKKAGKGTKKAGKGTKKAGKGTKKAGKGTKKGKSKTKKAGGKRKGSGR